MKRTTPDHVANNRSVNNPPSQVKEEEEHRAENEGNRYNPKMKQKGGKVKPLSPEDMEARFFLTLASTSEIENKDIHIKIGIPDPTNSVLPFDVTNKIASFIPPGKAQSNFALTNRSNYLNFDINHPLRRFPGLVGDLRRTRHFLQLARLELMKKFDDQIKSNGGYDNVLLTPLSPLSRLSTAIAMLVWAKYHTIQKDKLACIKLAQNRLLTEFTSLKNNPAIKPDKLHYTLMMAIRAVLNAPDGETKPTRSLTFNMEAGKEIILALKNDQFADAIERVIFFEVYKTYPYDAKNNDYLEEESSRWPLEHLAVAMMFQMTPLFFDRLKELPPNERPSAVNKIIKAMLTTPHAESHSHYAANIIRICAMCFATLNRELSSETHLLVTSTLDLFRIIANRLHPNNSREAEDFRKGFDYGDPLKGSKVDKFFTDIFCLKIGIHLFKGYVYRRMMDWIKEQPDPVIATQMASALNASFNLTIPKTPHTNTSH